MPVSSRLLLVLLTVFAGCAPGGSSSSSSSSSSSGGSSGSSFAGISSSASSGGATSHGSSLPPSSASSAAGSSSSRVTADGGTCAGAWLDQAGQCRTPSDGMYHMECCGPFDCDQAHALCNALPPSCNDREVPSVRVSCWGPCVPVSACTDVPAALCTSTSGTWHTGGCGNYHCGAFPTCAALIPGCDCGVNRNFVDGEGCVVDRACLAKLGESCGGLSPDPRECEPGLACDMTPPDGGSFDMPGVCVATSGYLCTAERPCPTGAECCYPCGIPGCDNVCMFVDGGCPLIP